MLVLVLLAILIVLVGGPLALGVTVGIPAWLAWTGIGMILPPLFWLLVALVLVFVGVFAAVILGALLPRPGWRQCPDCGTKGNRAHQFCQKCMHDFGSATPVRLPDWPPRR